MVAPTAQSENNLIKHFREPVVNLLGQEKENEGKDNEEKEMTTEQTLSLVSIGIAVLTLFVTVVRN